MSGMSDQEYAWDIGKTPGIILKNTPKLHMEQTNLNITTHFMPGIGQIPLICYYK